MLFLVLSLAMLLVGPLSYAFAERAPWALKVLDVIVIVSVGALVVLHIVPETFERGGWLLILPMLVGLLGPTLIERALSGLERQAHIFVMILVLLGLGVHALIDGVGLMLPDLDDHALATSLPLAVVLHRIPVSLLIWWLIRPTYGVFAASLALAVEGLGTVIGYASAHVLGPHISSPTLMVVQALVAGSLLHVVVDRRDYARGHVH